MPDFTPEPNAPHPLGYAFWLTIGACMVVPVYASFARSGSGPENIEGVSVLIESALYALVINGSCLVLGLVLLISGEARGWSVLFGTFVGSVIGLGTCVWLTP